MRRTHETLSISAVLNSHDALLGRRLGLREDDFHGYRDEYAWVLEYYRRYESCPTEQQFLVRFPEFPHDPDFDEIRPVVDEVLKAASCRNLLKILPKAQRDLLHGDVADAYEHFKGIQLRSAAARGDNLLNDPAFLDDYTDPHEVRILTPWDSLNEHTGGIGPGELWYLGARQGHGKSAFLVDMAVEAAMSGFRVNIFSLEMTKRQIQVRAHAASGRRLGAKVNSAMMLHREYDQHSYKQLLETIADNVPGNIAVHDSSKGRVTPSVIASSVADYDLTVIDYVGLMYSDDNQPAIRDHRVMAEISNNLKEIALSQRSRILGASQINREGESNGYARRPPRLKHLAQSDHLGNDGDLVLTMARYSQDVAVLSMEKNRHGESGRLFYTNFTPNTGDFTEITKEHADDLADAYND